MAIDYDIAIVGGGAAGLAAAVAAGQQVQAAGRQASIGILEADDRVGRSILVTGNGRCNFSNSHIQPELYRNASFVQQALASLGNDDAVLDFFVGWGLEWRTEAEGRMYPLANKASVVVDVLRAAAARVGVREACGRAVAKVVGPQRSQGHLTLHLDDGVLMRAKRVVIACGGKATARVELDGLGACEAEPLLGPIRVAEADRAFTHELDNVRVRCEVCLVRPDGLGSGRHHCVGSEKGELLFRPYGVSGICVFNLSRLAQPGDALLINFLQTNDLDDAVGYLRQRQAVLSGRYGGQLDYSAMLRGLVLPRVADALLKRAGLKAADLVRSDDLEMLVQMLCRCALQVEGIGDAAQCQVHRGGVSVEDVDPCTMQARRVEGLYAAGEALDVDGPCGGYNLHWAWASGLLAGRHAAASLRDAAGHTGRSA